jgi:hypothetical protein
MENDQRGMINGERNRGPRPVALGGRRRLYAPAGPRASPPAAIGFVRRHGHPERDRPGPPSNGFVRRQNLRRQRSATTPVTTRSSRKSLKRKDSRAKWLRSARWVRSAQPAPPWVRFAIRDHGGFVPQQGPVREAWPSLALFSPAACPRRMGSFGARRFRWLRSP